MPSKSIKQEREDNCEHKNVELGLSSARTKKYIERRHTKQFRQSGDFSQKMAEILQKILERILEDSIEKCEEKNRKTVSRNEINEAIMQNDILRSMLGKFNIQGTHVSRISNAIKNV